MVQKESLPRPDPSVETKVLRQSSADWLRQPKAAWEKCILEWLSKWEWTASKATANMNENITWLELLIGYEIDSNTTIPAKQELEPHDHHNLSKQDNITQTIAAFRKMVQHIVQNHCPVDARAMFEKPLQSDSAKGRLECLAITGNWMTMNTCPIWHNDLWEKGGSSYYEACHA